MKLSQKRTLLYHTKASLSIGTLQNQLYTPSVWDKRQSVDRTLHSWHNYRL
ncbi:MAG: hypothetical protein LBT46_05550 [Planctomycetaceae bacterium]|nr:hypothetical protein [Planctomycetaceae bacterium]